MRLLLSVDLIFEALTTLALLAVPGMMVAWVFSADLPPEFSLYARIAGVGLGLFVIGCWMAWRRGRQRAARIALIGYNIFAIVLLVAFEVLYEPIGPLLWPAVGIHIGLTAGLVFIGERSWQSSRPASLGK